MNNLFNQYEKDLFLINYEEFKDKYNKLKYKYGINFLKEDISILEQIYTV